MTAPPPEIFHIATADDWAAAQSGGDYTTSTVGRSLAEEGFIHASTREQVRGVFERYYRSGDQPLVLLQIDPGRLDAEVRMEPADPKKPLVRYPHIYGPLPVAAVTKVTRLRAGREFPSVLEMWLGTALLWIALAIMAMLLSFAGAAVGERLHTEWGEFLGAVGGLLIGAVVALLVVRRRG